MMYHPFVAPAKKAHRYPFRQPCRKSSSGDLCEQLLTIDERSAMSPRTPSAREKRLTVAAGTGDAQPLPTKAPDTSPTSSRSHLQRTDHIPKCPQRNGSVRKRSGSSFSGDGTDRSTAIELARRRARQLRRRRIVSGVITAFVALISGAVGFFAFKFGTEYVLQREEEIRQAVRDQEFQPLIEEYRLQMDVLMRDQKYLQERLRQAEASSSAGVVASTQTDHTDRLQLSTSNDHQNSSSHHLTVQRADGEQYTQGIQSLSKQMLADNFGAGPYYVEFQIEFPSDSHADAAVASPKGRLLLELASADQMPHTVYTFLARVSKGLYDGCSFYHNAGHVLVAGARPNAHTPPGVDLRQRFVQSGLEKVHFQEYNPEYFHKEWTVGLAGRPGGTEFYVNMRDNSVDHGPGGQTKYEDPSQADPCFARVVAGFTWVERMRSLQDKGVESRVAILQARIVV